MIEKRAVIGERKTCFDLGRPCFAGLGLGLGHARYSWNRVDCMVSSDAKENLSRLYVSECVFYLTVAKVEYTRRYG